MAYSNLQEFIDLLEKENELIRIKTFANPILEIAEITDRISKQPDGGKAILFENTGTNFPVLINAYGSLKRMQLAIGAKNLDDVGNEIEQLFKNLSSPKDTILDKLRLIPKLSEIAGLMPRKRNGRGTCQEIIDMQPDIFRLPVLKCWPYDGGQFVTLPNVITEDPTTKIRNVGMYRMQLFEKNITGMHWHKHKTGERHYQAYKTANKKMPVAVTLGGDPAYTYSATAPLPDNIDEYILAGFLRKKKVELVKCITNDLYVPADVDFVIEGFIDPTEEKIIEGPFGDHTGFYSLPDLYPKFHITCITHRKNAIYPATIVGIPPQEDAWIAKATERIFLSPIKLTMIPEILDMNMPDAGVAHNITIIKIKKDYAGQAGKVMNALWGAGQMMFNKIMAVTDGDIQISNYKEFAKQASEVFDPSTDIYLSRGPLDVLDHSANKMSFGGKIGFDLTKKTPEETSENEYNENLNFDFDNLKTYFNDIYEINADLITEDISVVFISLQKKSDTKIYNTIKQIFEKTANAAKIVVLFDYFVNIKDINAAIWLAGNNFEPSRDTYLMKNELGQATLFVDATAKTYENDNFRRDWPNIIVSTDETIAEIDKKWNLLEIGDFIESPSIKYKKLIINKGAYYSKKS